MRRKGFSLIELVITVAIIGILALFTYKLSVDYLARLRRLDGQSALMDLAMRMETYFSKAGTYETATIGLGEPTDLLSTAVSTEGWYTLAIVSQTGSSYLLEARPRSTQAVADRGCPLLSIDSRGVKRNKVCWP